MERGADNGTVRCSRLIQSRFHFLCGLHFVFKYFPYINCLKNVNLEYICINGPLAQLVERGANNTYIISSRLTQSRFHFLCGLLSVFNYFPYTNCLKNINFEYICTRMVPWISWKSLVLITVGYKFETHTHTHIHTHTHTHTHTRLRSKEVEK